MERKIKRQKKVKQQNRKMRKIHKKYSLIAQVQLWLERHSKLASFMDGGIILFSIFGIMYVLFGTSLIPKPYQELSYVLPIIMNFVFLVHTLYQGIFRDGFSNKASVNGFLKTFLFINGPIFLLHLLVGVKGRNVKKNSFPIICRLSVHLASNCYLSNLFHHSSDIDGDFEI